MKLKKPLIVVSIIVMMIGPGINSAIGEVSINLKKKSSISGENIFLKNIASLDGDKEDIKELGSVYIGKLPLPGTKRTVNKEYIKTRIKQTKADMSEITLTGPNRIKVMRESVEISQEEIREIARRFLLKKIQQEGANISIKNIKFNGNVLVPSNKEITYEVKLFKNSIYGDTCLLDIIFKADAQMIKKVRVEADIERMAPVFITSRPIEKNEVISEEDIYVQERGISDLPNKVIWDIKDIIGKRAKRDIQANTIFRRNLLEFPPLVKKGELVTILAESGSIRITTKGEATENGSKGDFIKVRNLNSKKIIGGIVLDRNMVKVDF